MGERIVWRFIWLFWILLTGKLISLKVLLYKEVFRIVSEFFGEMGFYFRGLSER